MKSNSGALILRQAATEAHLPSTNSVADECIRQAKAELHFIKRYEKTKGWTKYHTPFVMQMMSCLRQLEKKISLTRSRGDGRLATILDVTQNTGCGLARAMRSVETFNDLEPAEREIGPSKTSYPLIDILPYSSKVLSRLDYRIMSRKDMRGRRGLLESERRSLLLDSAMTDDALIRQTIEYMARAFARQVDPEIRHELICGDGRPSLKAAFDTLSFQPA